MARQEINLLSDAQVQRFILDGFLILPVDELGEDFHADFYQAAMERSPRGIVSDATDALMPEIGAVLNSPTVRGALQGLLGDGYIRHPHSGVSVESVEEAAPSAVPIDQGWHRDSYWGVQRVHHHRPRWLLCMYYPADVTIDMGPTAIAPGSHYYSLPGDGDGRARPPIEPIRHDQIDDPQRLMLGADLRARDQLLRKTIESLEPSLREVPMVVKGGSFCLFHYDSYHRRMRRGGAGAPATPPRVMFKLLFTCGRARTAPSWDHGHSDPSWAQHETTTIPRVLSESIWARMLGATTAGSGPASGFDDTDHSTAQLTDVLHRSQCEHERMAAAYQLSQAGRAGNAESVRQLVDVLQHGSDAAQRAAMHALAAAGPVAVEPLLAVLAEPDVDHHVACCAVHALGEAAETPSLAMVKVVAELSDRIKQTIEAESRAAGGWPAGGGGHPAPSGFGFRSPNPKERQAWTPKLLHASCLQTLGVLGQRAQADGADDVVHAIIEQCIACLNAPEPGGSNPDYPADSALGSLLMSRQNAALGLRMLCVEGSAISPKLRQVVVDACSGSAADPDKFLAHYCRDTLHCISGSRLAAGP